MRQAIFFEEEIKKNTILAPTISKKIRDSRLDFKNVSASEGVYGIHPYPAMLHFLLVRKLIENYSNERDRVLDPFCGSGVVGVEAVRLRRNFIGYDINPLATLIANARLTSLSSGILLGALNKILALQLNNSKKKLMGMVLPARNLDYWFSKTVQIELYKLKLSILNIVRENLELKCFFETCFSETVRSVSYTRPNEFKLYRRSDYEKFEPDVLATFNQITQKNIKLLRQDVPRRTTQCKIAVFDVRNRLPIKHPVELVLTSPPYGDSRTTVAYGQFSRLSLEWLGIEETVDKESLGRKNSSLVRDINHLPSPDLIRALKKVKKIRADRFLEANSFYWELYSAIVNISKKIKEGGFACFVVGNRRVCGIEMPTDSAIADFLCSLGFRHVRTLIREITSKRMPLENSPSNVEGEKETTMRWEYIVVCQKR